MYCRICGDEENVKYYPAKRQTLCTFCAKDTPRKVSRETFDKRYWVSDDPNEAPPPESIKLEFYADYLASGDTLDEYIEATTSYVC